jgi:hypothetical protein
MPNPPLCSSQRSQIDGAQPASGQLQLTNKLHRIHLQTPVYSKQSLPLLPHSGFFLLHLHRLQNVLPFGPETAPGRGPPPCTRARSSSPADLEHIPSWPRDHPPVPSQAGPVAQSELIKNQNRRLVDRSARETNTAGRSKSADHPQPQPACTRANPTEPMAWPGLTERKASTSKQQEKPPKNKRRLTYPWPGAARGAAERKPAAAAARGAPRTQAGVGEGWRGTCEAVRGVGAPAGRGRGFYSGSSQGTVCARRTGCAAGFGYRPKQPPSLAH